MDVSSLYTNIPNDAGISASAEILNNFRPQKNLKPTNNSIIKLLEMVLKKNNFSFNGNHFIQVGGTAMGTKAAVAYACTYMGNYEANMSILIPSNPSFSSDI